jgi:hypothetical protein
MAPSSSRLITADTGPQRPLLEQNMTAQHQASGATGSAPGANLSAHTPMMHGCFNVDLNGFLFI